jgi:hypothetical protein
MKPEVLGKPLGDMIDVAGAHCRRNLKEEILLCRVAHSNVDAPTRDSVRGAMARCPLGYHLRNTFTSRPL